MCSYECFVFRVLFKGSHIMRSVWSQKCAEDLKGKSAEETSQA